MAIAACFFGFFFPLLVFAAPKISSEELKSEITAKILKVSQFKFIKELAQKMGVRVWIFGGTAAGFGHYVRWDLERRKGDSTYQAEKFDYNYLNIYRPTQDCDLVIDGTVKQAEAFEEIVRGEFPHLQGSKILWEIRLLSKDRGDKEALLKNSDFLNQNTDSNSVGMIELTDSKNRIQDLRSWNSDSPDFLNDLAAGRIRYLPSGKHEETKRFREGRNPHIFSVIRFLIKVFQYNLEILDQDRREIIKRINEFDWSNDITNQYARNWIEKNAKKLYQQAIDLERAGEILDQVGLRRKLINIGSIHEKDSMPWWMNREPLKTYHIKSVANSKTANDLGISIVAHETIDFVTYEAIMKSPRGLPNVFISREKAKGENAYHGEGFYTRKGREGARGTGFTIRFRVDPRAVEGKDFRIFGDYFLVLNRSIITVIPESLNLSALEYLELVWRKNWKSSDRGLFEKFQYLVQMNKKMDRDEAFKVLTRRFKYMREFLLSSYSRNLTNEYRRRSHSFRTEKSNNSEDLFKTYYAFPDYAFYVLEVFRIYGQDRKFLHKLNWKLGDFFDLANRLDIGKDRYFITQLTPEYVSMVLEPSRRGAHFLSMYQILMQKQIPLSEDLRWEALKIFVKMEEANRAAGLREPSDQWKALIKRVRGQAKWNSMKFLGMLLSIPLIREELLEDIPRIESTYFQESYTQNEIEAYLTHIYPQLTRSHLLDLIESEIANGGQSLHLKVDLLLELFISYLFNKPYDERLNRIVSKLMRLSSVEAIFKMLNNLYLAGSVYEGNSNYFKFAYFVIQAINSTESLSDKMKLSRFFQEHSNESLHHSKFAVYKDLKTTHPKQFEAVKYFLKPSLITFIFKQRSEGDRRYSDSIIHKSLGQLIHCREAIEQFVRTNK